MSQRVLRSTVVKTKDEAFPSDPAIGQFVVETGWENPKIYVYTDVGWISFQGSTQTGESSDHDPVTLDSNADTLLELAVQQIGLDDQSANTVFAGPSSGSNAVPSFRHLVNADLPLTTSIWLISGSSISRYEASSSGLSTALSAAISGDTVIVPPGTYTGNYSVPDGVTVVGMSHEDVILSGQVTLGDGSVLENLSVARSENTADDVYGVLAPTGGCGYVYGCTISVENAGTGGGYGILINGFLGSEDEPGLVGCHVYGSTADVTM